MIACFPHERGMPIYLCLTTGSSAYTLLDAGLRVFVSGSVSLETSFAARGQSLTTAGLDEAKQFSPPNKLCVCGVPTWSSPYPPSAYTPAAPREQPVTPAIVW